VPAEPYRSGGDGYYYPANNPPDGVILRGPRYYRSADGGLVRENDVPTAYYYEPRPYRRNDWRQHDTQHFQHHQGVRP
jgi:hypothetical protein